MARIRKAPRLQPGSQISARDEAITKPRTSAPFPNLSWASLASTGCCLLISSIGGQQLQSIGVHAFLVAPSKIFPQSRRGVHLKYRHLVFQAQPQQQQDQDLVDLSSGKGDNDVFPPVSEDILARSYRLVAESDPEWFSEYVVSTFKTESSRHDDDKETVEGYTLDIAPSLQELIQQFENGEIKHLPKEDRKSKTEDEENRRKQRMQGLRSMPIKQQSKPDSVVPDAGIADEASPGPDPARFAIPTDYKDDNMSSPPRAARENRVMPRQNEIETENSPIKSTQTAPKQSTKQQQQYPKASSKPTTTILDDVYEGILSVLGQTGTTGAKSASDGEQQRGRSTAKVSLMEDEPSSPSRNVPNSKKPLPDQSTKEVSPVESVSSAPAQNFATAQSTSTPVESKSVKKADEMLQVEANAIPKEERVVLFRSRKSKPFKQAPLVKLRELGFTKDDEIITLDPDALGLIVSENVRRPKKGVPSYWEEQGGQGQVLIVDAIEAQELSSRTTGAKPLSSPQRPSASTINLRDESTLGPKKVREIKENSQSRSSGPTSEAKAPTSGEPRSGAARDPFQPGPEVPRKRGDVNSGAEQQFIAEKQKQEVSESQSNRMEVQNNPEYPATPPPEENRRFVVYRSENAKSSFKKVSLDRLEALGYQEEEIRALMPDALAFIVAENVPKPKRGIPRNWKDKEGLDTAENEQKGVRIMAAAEAVAFLTNIPNRQERLKGRRPKDAAEEQMLDRDVNNRRGRRERPASMEDDEPERREKRRRSGYNDDGQLKPIYSGRPPSFDKSKMNRRADPPKSSGFWPDIDTFRSLLREEAKLRVSLLGDGMSDMVKSECDWRLELYKDWLWTLHDGVGNPIVESRSDRARRMGALASPPPPPPSSKKKSRRDMPRTRPRTRKD